MPPLRRREVAVKNYNGFDCWRTWFFNECQSYHLFGVTAGHLSRIVTYKIGTLIYLEDDPYFQVTSQHRIYGPFRIVGSTPTDPYKKIKEDNGEIVIYEQINPSRGPWLDKPDATRVIKGKRHPFPQLASEWEFFPYRFSIQRNNNSGYSFVQHRQSECSLCCNKKQITSQLNDLGSGKGKETPNFGGSEHKGDLFYRLVVHRNRYDH